MLQLIGTLAVVVSVLVLAYQARELAAHTKVANDVAGVETHRELMRHWKSILDVFIEYPELHPQYYGKATAPASASDGVRLTMIAEQQADWLEAGLLTSRGLGSYESDFGGEWEDYAASCVASSPVLRAHVRANPVMNPPVTALLARYDASHESEIPPAT
jgi:hypothetical protein